MKLRFDREAALWACLILIVEVLIATVWAHHRWLRGFVGDVLAVVWVYFLLKVVIKANAFGLALVAFAVGCLVELAQYVATANGWHVQNPVLKILLGSVADWMDVLAYAGGFLLVLALESLFARPQPAQCRPSPAIEK
ncbi:DUF2809 domain-containing protein [Polaromonas sp. A23]|uniref:ribosomal maturation YjgA family protein n=1 Tax=Polaromonas sp. A23 TaxID=1944133 RepID=UPI0009864F3F|nr:DUF2809 domain-containing protein [Polaromonas sp. A23]OOG44203.1 hypothetical protein B0B52_07460 [Polaromonas sp. A23]